MGFLTLDLARMVGPTGRVVISELQPRMLDRLRHRAARAGVTDRIEFRLATSESLNVGDLAGQIDFALVFAVAHEVPDQRGFFAQIQELLRPNGSVLVVEPRGHVSDAEFARTLDAATAAGFMTKAAPPVRSSHAIVLQKRSEGHQGVARGSTP
jgi:ubiquinone/menaquinone biosynthesis C-methylase UbiE